MRIAKVIDRCAPGRDQFVGDGDDRVQAHAPGINLPGVIGLSELKKRDGICSLAESQFELGRLQPKGFQISFGIV